MAEKKPKKIVSSGFVKNKVLTRFAQPGPRRSGPVLRSTIRPPGAPCLRLTIKSY